MQLSLDFTAADGKVCKKCGTWKPLVEGYWVARENKDGRRSICKECMRQTNLRDRIYDAEGRKKCPRCQEFKPSVQYRKNRSQPSGITSRCWNCESIEKREKTKANAAKQHDYSRTGEKRCSSCKQVLALSKFVKDRSNADGYGKACKKCASARTMAYALRNAAKEHDYTKIGTKTCSKCKQTLDFKEFVKSKYSHDGYLHYCKGCACLIRRNWRSSNLDHARALDKIYTQRYRDTKQAYRKRTSQQRRAYNAAWRQKNRDKFLAREARRRERCKEKIRERFKKWANSARGNTICASTNTIGALKSERTGGA